MGKSSHLELLMPFLPWYEVMPFLGHLFHNRFRINGYGLQ